ncbi:MAG: LecA/PA-IL family lectin [Blastocatellia bacterium]
MSNSLKLFRTVVSLLMVVIFAVATFADTIRLKDGSIIKGKITSFSGGTFTVVVGEGSRRKELSFAAADIESIEFDSDRGETVPLKVPSNNGTSQSARYETVVTDGTIQKIEKKTVSDQQSAKVEKIPEIIPASTGSVIPPSTSKGKPIELNVKVLADNTANGWTNSGWVVKKGQKIRISGNGEVSLGSSNNTGPSGLSDLDDSGKLLKGVPTGALIAVIGDDNNDFIYIGGSREFVAARDGALFLGVNEGNLEDNSGSFDVKIEIYLESGE